MLDAIQLLLPDVRRNAYKQVHPGVRRQVTSATLTPIWVVTQQIWGPLAGGMPPYVP